MESKFERWQELSGILKTVKVEEMKLRKELAAEYLIDQVPPCKIDLYVGSIKIRVENGVSHALDAEVVNQIFEDLNDEEKSAMQFKPSLKLREYKKLPNDSLLKEAVTVKPSAPTIKIL